MTRQQLAAKIDHTLLKPEATLQQVKEVVAFTLKEKTASVCLNSCWVPFAAKQLSGSGVAVCTVIGFPLGAANTATKTAEAKAAYAQGATELDMVLNIGALRSGLHEAVQEDISAVAAASPALLKVIIETCFLTDAEIIAACKLCAKAGAAFVKTSTGFGPAGATAEHVQLMRSSIPPHMQVKASGGIATLSDALTMLNAGAARLGTSRTADILNAL